MKATDRIIVALFYALIYGARMYFLEFYLSAVPTSIADKYIYCSCFGGCTIRFEYEWPFILAEIIFLFYIVTKQFRDYRLPSKLLLMALVYFSFKIVSTILIILFDIVNLDFWVIHLFAVEQYSIGVVLIDVIAGLLNILLIFYLLRRYQNKILKAAAQFSKFIRSQFNSAGGAS